MIKKLFAAAVFTALCNASAVQAQNFPNKPIRVIVAAPAGAITDVVSRRIAAAVSPIMGQTLIMENRSGANFIPGAEACRQAKPDGYTLCIFTTSSLLHNSSGDSPAWG